MLGAMVLGYLGLQVLIGLWLSRRISDSSAFFQAGRSLGLPLVAFSLFATWFGAETCIGSSGAVYAQGLSGSRADPIGYGLCLLLMGILLAGRLWRRGYTSLGGFFRDRFGLRTEVAASWLLNLASLFWAAAQLRAFGQVIALTTSVDVTFAIVASAVVVIGYTLMGGLLGDILTDFIQGIVISIGLLWIGFESISLLSSTDLTPALVQGRLALIGPGESIWERMDRWMIPILGSLVTQELASRVLAARSESIARNASLVACGIYLFVGAIPVVLGLFGPALVPDIVDSEKFLLALAKDHLPQIGFVAFSGALLSAMLATIDSILLAIAALFSGFLPTPKGLPQEQGKLLVARVIVVVAGVLATLLALASDGIYSLIEFASSFGTAGILIITLVGLYSRLGGERAALSALALGVVGPLLGEHWLALSAPFLSSVAVVLVLYCLVGLGESRKLAV